VRKLQDLGVEIDVYGACGNFSCPMKSVECDEMLNSTYKFYFSFENNLCSDYLTEKTFRIMSYFVLPVVFSGANYANFLPPNSYVDAENFKTTEELANHLKHLANNPKELVKYWWWKKSYKIVSGRDVTLQHACSICERLNDPGIYEEKKVIQDPESWISFNACRTPSIII
jgi:alpha-1,3-fucosyltransferase